MFLRYLPFSPERLSFDFLSSEPLQINANLYIQSTLDEGADKAIFKYNTRIHRFNWIHNFGWKLDLIQEALGSRNKGQKPSYLVEHKKNLNEFEQCRVSRMFTSIV